jgi:DNA-binding NtrC family response regulator
MSSHDSPVVLVVEDLDNWRDVVTGILSNEYQVLLAKSYAEAIQALDVKGSLVDLVIVDISLDIEDRTDEAGMRLLEYIAEYFSWISTIILTGYPSFRTVRKALKDFMAFDYIEKYPEDGFDVPGFREVVRKAISTTRDQRSILGLLAATSPGEVS